MTETISPISKAHRQEAGLLRCLKENKPCHAHQGNGDARAQPLAPPQPGPWLSEGTYTLAVCFSPKYMFQEWMNMWINQNLRVLCFNPERWFVFFFPQSPSVLTSGLWCLWCCLSSRPWLSLSLSTSALWVITGALLMAEVRPAAPVAFLHFSSCQFRISVLLMCRLPPP